MNTDAEKHWSRVYAEKDPTQVSWYQPVPTRSLAMIESGCKEISRDHAGPIRIVDVGGGASTLVDNLVEQSGFEVCVVDIAGTALATAKKRLGDRASRVKWIEADVTGTLSPIDAGWADVWHDRAVFHFLTSQESRRAYARNLGRIVRQGGRVIIATFASDGPTKCSNLEVCRYDSETLQRELKESGIELTLNSQEREEHVTPWGAVQRFNYAMFIRP